MTVKKHSHPWAAIALAGLLAYPCPAVGAAKKRSSGGTTASTSRKLTPHHPATRSSGSQKLRASTRRGRNRRRHTLSQLHLDSGRVKEIQSALAQAGYLHGELTGQWDDRTRDAMRRYQADNGFPTTGLPEARSLMKLGLGPHPLPEDVDPRGAARASVDSTTRTNPSVDPHTRGASVSPGSPHQN